MFFSPTGTQNASRLEIEEADRKRRGQKNHFTYSLDFKTSFADGILFYGSGKRHIDFVALYVKDGKVSTSHQKKKISLQNITKKKICF